MTGVFNVVLLGLLAGYGTDAAVVSNFRGNQQMQVDTVRGSQVSMTYSGQVPTQAAEMDYASLGLGAGIGAVIAAAVAFGVMKAMGGGAAEETKEGEEAGEEKAEAAAVPVVEEAVVEEAEDAGKGADYQALLKVLAQKVAQEVGPKLSKGGAVGSVLEHRMSHFTTKAKEFLLNEIKGAAGETLRELDAPEAMMLLDWDSAVEANFPAPSILIAGVLSPTVINLMSLHHFIQVIVVALPTMILCICAIYIDWSAPCSIPTIFSWLFTQSFLAGMLVIGHSALLFKVWLGRRTIAAKAAEVAGKTEGDAGVMDQFVGNTTILQEALLVENGIRHSVWNTIVGLATTLWVFTTIWNLVLICGWTFVPGVTAFHPDAAEVAKDDYCGAWMTVLVLRINILLAVLFLFFNLATVVKWICDIMIDSQGFQDAVLGQARDMDKNGSGLPVCELMVKAFLLRGNTDTLNSRLSVVQARKAVMEKEKAAVAAKLAAVQSEVESCTTEEKSLKVQAEAEGGDIATQVAKLTEGAEAHDNWKTKMMGASKDMSEMSAEAKEKAEAQARALAAEAEAKAREVQEATTKALEELWEKISKMVDAAQNSETAKALREKYHELEAKMNEAMATLQDPAFQQQLLEQAQQASAQAKELADSAVAAAKDPEMQKKLNQMAHEAMEKAQKAAEEVAAAANDPVKRAQLQEAAQKAMDQAKAQASEAAAGLTDPAMQEKMKQAAQNAIDQAQLAAESAIAAAQDPELQKKMQEAAQKAMDDAKEAAKKVQEAVNDPALKKQLEEAAKKAMDDAKAAAEQAKAAAMDPELQKKLAAAAEKYKEQAEGAVKEATK